MTVHSYDDPDFFASITPEEYQWQRSATQAFGMDCGTVIMGDPSDAQAPAVMMLELPPGGRLHRHEHGCYRVEVLVRGSLESDDGRVLRPGDVAISAPGEFYGPYTAGPNGSLTAEVFSESAGLSNVIYDENDDESMEMVARVRREIDEQRSVTGA